MFKTKILFLLLIIVIINSYKSIGQDKTRLFILDSLIGETIDSTERENYYILPFYSKETFKEAKIYTYNDSLFLVKALMKDSSSTDTIVSIDLINEFKDNVKKLGAYYKIKEEEKVIGEQKRESYQQQDFFKPDKKAIIEKGKLLKIEVPFYFAQNFVSYPSQTEPILSMKGKMGYDYGVGVKLGWDLFIKPSLGIKYWTKPVVSEFSIFGSLNDSTEIILDVKEDGKVNYAGLYGSLRMEGRRIIVGGNMHVSLINWYGSNAQLTDSLGNTYSENNLTESYFINGFNDFNNQYEFGAYIGVKIPINDNIKVYPVIDFSYSVKEMFDSNLFYYVMNIYYPEKRIANYNSFIIRFGIIAEFGF